LPKCSTILLLYYEVNHNFGIARNYLRYVEVSCAREAFL